MFRNILVAIDGSPSADPALEEAIDLARSDGARLVVLSVAAPPRWRFSGMSYVPYPTEQELVDSAWEAVKRAGTLVPSDVAVETRVRIGQPAREIVAQAEEGGYDVVVMGSRGLGSFGSLLLGSVSRAVAARSSIPVLIADGQASRPLAPTLPSEPHANGTATSAAVEAPTSGAATIVLWLVAALLLELELALWAFDRMYSP